MNRRKRKRIQKIKKTIFSLFIIALIIILIFSIKSCSKNLKNKDEIYGYVAVTSNSQSKILELHTKNENVEIEKIDDMIYGFNLKNNKLIYYTKNSSNKATVKYIDLNNSNLISKTIVKDIDLNYTFDITDKYLVVSLQKNGIKKYDLETGKDTIILDTIGAYDFFILDNKMYGTTYRYENKKSVQKYFTCTLDGYEFNWIDKEKYDELKNKQETSIVGSEKYLIIDDKKATLSEDNNKLLYDGEIVYSVNNSKIKLMYTEEQEKIAFSVYTSESDEDSDDEYYIYDIKDKNISKVGKNTIYDIIFVNR